MEIMKTGQTLMTGPNNAYKVREGTVQIFIVPEENGKQRRPLHLTDMAAGGTIPALSYMDDSYVTWSFQLKAKEPCQLQIIDGGSTKILRRRFLEHAGIAPSEGLGFEESLIQIYEGRIISDDVFISKTEQQRQQTRAQTEETIQRIISHEEKQEETDREESPDQSAELKAAGKQELPAGEPVWQQSPEDRVQPQTGSGRKDVNPAFRALRSAGLLSFADLLHPDRTARKLQEEGFNKIFHARESFLRKTGRRNAAAAVMEIDPRTRSALKDLWRTVIYGIIAAAALAELLILAGHHAAGLSAQAGQEAAAAGGAGGILLVTLLTVLAAICFGAGLYVSRQRAGRLKEAFAQGAENAEKDMYQFLRNMEKIRLAGAEEHVIGRYYEHLEQAGRARWRKERRGIGGDMIAKIAGWMVITGIFAAEFGLRTQLGHTEMILLAAGMFVLIFCAVAAFAGAQRIRVGTERLHRILEEAGFFEEDGPAGNEEPAEPEVMLEMKNVEFVYEADPVLKDIDLEIRRGEQVGVAGVSGSGKSTLLKLLAGLERETSGQLLRRKVRRGVVLQQEQLIAGSILDNIRAGDPDISREQILQAIDDVCLGDDLERLPMGGETLIDESGESVSAGQKQKILLARALAKDPELLLLDESESELDEQTQRHLRQRLKERGMACVIASHHLRLVAECDRIIVLDGGTIAEEGTPEELLARNGAFYQLMKRQV